MMERNVGDARSEADRGLAHASDFWGTTARKHARCCRAARAGDCLDAALPLLCACMASLGAAPRKWLAARCPNAVAMTLMSMDSEDIVVNTMALRLRKSFLLT